MKALITGITGQDGFYLARQLVRDGHEVVGMMRGQRNPGRQALEVFLPSMQLIEGDLLDQSSLVSVLKETSPDVVFNLGAITFVGLSWQQPALMSEVTGLGVLRLLEAIRHVNPGIRLLQASSSEQFGGVTEVPQNERTPFHPRSPYGTAKTFAHHTVVNYRESYGIHASTAIMFNHESPRRGSEFVTRKVSLGAARIARHGGTLVLGNLNSQRDWGWCEDFMRALPLIVTRDEPDDFVIATGETHTVEELVSAAFAVVGLDWHEHVEVSDEFMRPADVELLLGDASKAERVLGWKSRVTFEKIVRRMVEHDCAFTFPQEKVLKLPEGSGEVTG